MKHSDQIRILQLLQDNITLLQAELLKRMLIAPHQEVCLLEELHTIYRSALTMLRQYEASRSESLTSTHTLVERVQAYIRNHLSEDISLQSLSEQVYLHPVYLSAMYKSRTGEGLSEYMMRIKMEHASKLLLSDSSSKIYEVARETGYRNSSYFSKVFKDRFGLTPLEYRKANAPYSKELMKS
jgi:two-component system response regulator YesN